MLLKLVVFNVMVEFIAGQFTSTPPDNQEVCVGADVTLDWRFDHENDLLNVKWYRGPVKDNILVMTLYPPQAAKPADGVTNIQHLTNGGIKITDISLQYDGQYTCSIFYKISAGLPNVPASSVNVTVRDPPSVPTYQVTVSGQQSTYHCETVSTGTPAVVVKIKIGGILQSSSSSVVDFSKTVDCCVVGEASKCIPENKNGQTEYCTNAITPSGPDNMRLSPSTSIYTLNIGEKLGPVVCSADCVPNCTFTWNKGSSTNTLDLTIQDKTDRGTYTCTATRGTSTSFTDTRSLMVYVRYGPDSVHFNPAGPSFTGNEDSQLSIQCVSECYPNCAYNWKKQGEAQTITTSPTLTFDPLKRDDVGKYICTVSNKYSGVTGPVTSTATVTVRYGPDPVTFDPAAPSFDKNKGEQITIRCVSSCYPGCSYTWTKQGQSGTVSTTNKLSLRNIQTSHAGNYTCTVRNTYAGITTTKTGMVTLNVRYGPDSINFQPAGPSFDKNKGEQLTVRCKSSCYPGCSYTWTRQGQSGTLSTTDTLSISNIQTGHAGNYTCTVGNTYTGITTTKTGTVTLNVRYGPDNVTLTPAGESQTINEFQYFNNIICHADCYPTCTYKWTKQGQNGQVSLNATLPFGNRVPRTYAGVYKCTVTNPGQTYNQRSVDVIIHVNYGPDRAILSPDKTSYIVNKGTTFQKITCGSDCYPTCTNTWRKQGESNNIPTNNGWLDLGALDKTEAGVYICNASNNQLSQWKVANVSLFVRYGPDSIVLQPDNDNPSAVEGNKLPDIKCSSECYPGCAETWWNVTSNTRVGNGGTMALGTVFRYYTGVYNCTSSNQAQQYRQSKSRSIYLTIQYFPDVNIYTVGNGAISERNLSLTIECTSQGEPQADSYDITHLAPNGVKVRNLPGNKESGKQVVNLDSLSFMDSGIYICTVSNGIKNYLTKALNATDEVNVTVKGKPYISDSVKIIDVPVGGNISLNVSFYSNDGSEPGIKWFAVMNDSELGLSNSKQQKYRISTFADSVHVLYYETDVLEQGATTQLIIDHVNAEDFMTYKVIINNTIGAVNHTVVLAARGPPEKPYNFAVVDERKTTSSITLTWNSGFDGGADQTFHILYKTNTTEWQEWQHVVDNKKLHAQFNETISQLDPGTLYSFQIYAKNIHGKTYSSRTVYAETNVITATEEPSSIIAAAAGGGVGGAVVIIAVIVGVVFIKRRSGKKDPNDDVKKLSSDKIRSKENDDDVEVANPMYVSADDFPTTSNNNLYAVVDKSNKKSNKPSPEDKNLYAVVDKSKKNKEKDQQNELYTLPVKKPKDVPIKKEKPKKEKGKQKKKKKGKTDDNKDAMVYENADSMNVTSQDSENVYENPSCSTVDEEAKPKSPTRTKNPDGLIYLEVEVSKTNNTADRKLIIHGLEDRSDYADIAFGKVGEPAPESDEETEKKE